MRCPNSLVVKHVLGKDESQVRFLLRAPELYFMLQVCFFGYKIPVIKGFIWLQ